MNFIVNLGVTLGAAGESHTWDPNSKEEYPCSYKLIIKQILLGREAKESEYNVVQVIFVFTVIFIRIFNYITIFLKMLQYQYY